VHAEQHGFGSRACTDVHERANSILFNQGDKVPFSRGFAMFPAGAGTEREP